MAAFLGHVFRVDSTRNLFSLERGHVPFQQWIFFSFFFLSPFSFLDPAKNKFVKYLGYCTEKPVAPPCYTRSVNDEIRCNFAGRRGLNRWRGEKGASSPDRVSFSPRLGENLIKALLVRAFTNYRTKWNYVMQHLHSAIIMPRDFEITILQPPPPPFLFSVKHSTRRLAGYWRVANYTSTSMLFQSKLR